MGATAAKPPPSVSDPKLKSADLSDHSIDQLGTLQHGCAQALEFKVGTTHRSVPLKTSDKPERLTVLQRDLSYGTVYFLSDSDYKKVYPGYHSNKAPGPDNISFVLPEQGLILVRVASNGSSRSRICFEKGTLTVTESHRTVLDEAIKHGVLKLRGATEGAAQRAIETRRERIRAGGHLEGHENGNPREASQQDLTLSIKCISKGPAQRESSIAIQATAFTSGGSTIYLAAPAECEKLPHYEQEKSIFKASSLSAKSEVVIINSNKLSESLEQLSQELLSDPTPDKLELLRAIQSRIVQEWGELPRCGPDSFNLLVATLNRHRIEPLPQLHLFEALKDVCEAIPPQQDRRKLLREAFSIINDVLPSLTKSSNIDETLEKFGKWSTHSETKSSGHRQLLRGLAQERKTINDPSTRLEKVDQMYPKWIRLFSCPSDFLADQVNRVGHAESNQLIRELLKNAPVAIPQQAGGKLELVRNGTSEGHGPYLQASLASFTTPLTPHKGNPQTATFSVSWLTPEQADYKELPGYRVTVSLAGKDYAQTSIRKVNNPATANDGECFVSQAGNQLRLFSKAQAKVKDLGSLEDFGLFLDSKDTVYSRSDGPLHPANAAGERLADSPATEYIRSSRKLSYIPERMDLS